MVKVAVTWTIDLDIVSKINDESQKSGKSSSFLASYYLGKTFKTQSSDHFFECMRCHEQKATQQDGLCPACLEITQKHLKEQTNKEFDKIMNVGKETKKLEQEQKNEKVKELKRKIAIATDLLESIKKDKKKWEKSMTEEQITEHRINQKAKIKKYQVELKILEKSA